MLRWDLFLRILAVSWSPVGLFVLIGRNYRSYSWERLLMSPSPIRFSSLLACSYYLLQNQTHAPLGCGWTISCGWSSSAHLRADGLGIPSRRFHRTFPTSPVCRIVRHRLNPHATTDLCPTLLPSGPTPVNHVAKRLTQSSFWWTCWPCPSWCDSEHFEIDYLR